MAITDTAHDADLITRFFGLSTDTKPASAMIGATFLETDTEKQFIFDGEDWIRSKTVKVEQVGAVEVKEERNATTLLADILVQLQIQNAHLSLVTGERLGELDTEA